MKPLFKRLHLYCQQMTRTSELFSSSGKKHSCHFQKTTYIQLFEKISPSIISHAWFNQPLRYTLVGLVMALPQITLFGWGGTSNKAIAQTTSCPTGTQATRINLVPGSFEQTNGRTFTGEGGVSATFRFSESIPGGVIDRPVTLITPEVYGGLPGPNLFWNIGLDKTPAQGSATLTIDFNRSVTLASPLLILDIDRNGERDVGFIYQDRVTVTASNNGSPVDVTLRSQGTTTRIEGNRAVGINENSFPDRPDGNVSVTPAGEVSQIQILYEPGQEYGAPLQDESIGLQPISVCIPVERGAIGDTVYNDLNGNGRQDSGEPGLPSVNVNLVGAGEDNQFGTADDINQTLTTNDNGNYQFTELLPGQYRVSVPNPPQGFSPTQTFNDVVNLAPGQTFNDADFGFRQQRGLIGDEVFIDSNGNGTREEGEAGLADATLILRDANGEEIGRTTTNSNGIYGFTGLDLGNYSVEVLRPNDFTPTTSTNISASLTEENPSTTSVDFGLRPTRLGAGETANIRVVKRITGAFRNGQPLPVANFNTFNPDQNSNNDDALPGQERFVGVPRIETLLQSGDEVEYTVYFLTEGEEALQNTRFCDLVPAGTTFVNNSITVNGAGSNAQPPQYLTPLTPLDSFTDICGGNNTNGAVVNNLGTIPQNTFGFVRFRVGIN